MATAWLAFTLLCASPVSAQEAITYDQLRGMLTDSRVTTASILQDARNSCLAFVPTEERRTALRQLRRSLTYAEEQQLFNSCVRDFRIDSLADILALYRDGDRVSLAEMQRGLSGCPTADPVRGLKRLGRANVPSEVVQLVGSVCGRRLRERRIEGMGYVGYMPLSAARQLRSQGLQFKGGLNYAGRISYARSRAEHYGLALEHGAYDYGTDLIDFAADGHFALTSVSLTARYNVSCRWRANCGGYLYSPYDVFVEGALSLNRLHGEVTPEGAQSIEMTFKGPGAAAQLGYVRHLVPLVSIALVAETRLIQFGNAEARTDQRSVSKSLSGYSWRSGVFGALMINVPPL